MGLLPRHGKHHGNGVFRCGDRITKRRVHHHNPAGSGCGNVDIVDPDTRTPNNLEVFGGREHFFGDLCRRTDCQPVIITNAGDQFFRAHTRDLVYFDAALGENFSCARAQLV